MPGGGGGKKSKNFAFFLEKKSFFTGKVWALGLLFGGGLWATGPVCIPLAVGGKGEKI